LRAATVLLLMVAVVAGVLTAKDKGDKLFKEGQAAESREDWDHALELYLEAMGEFQKALIADPASSIAIQEIKRTQQMLNADGKQPSSNVEDRGLTPA